MWTRNLGDRMDVKGGKSGIKTASICSTRNWMGWRGTNGDHKLGFINIEVEANSCKEIGKQIQSILYIRGFKSSKSTIISIP
jgi:hypothetical protein